MSATDQIVNNRVEWHQETQGMDDGSASPFSEEFSALHDHALKVNVLFDQDLLPKRFRAATRIKALEGALECDDRIKKTTSDNRSFEEKLKEEDYFGRKARFCLNAILKRWRAETAFRGLYYK